MEENKRAICQALLVALWNTRAGRDLTDLEYHDNEYTDDAHVDAVFADGRRIRIDVTGDSGIAVIKDIIDHL